MNCAGAFTAAVPSKTRETKAEQQRYAWGHQ